MEFSANAGLSSSSLLSFLFSLGLNPDSKRGAGLFVIKSTLLKLLKYLDLTTPYSTVELDLFSAGFSVINYLQYNSYRLHMYKISEENGYNML